MLYRVQLAWARFELTTSVVIGTDYIGSYKIQLPYNHDHDGQIIVSVLLKFGIDMHVNVVIIYTLLPN
jgi:hypothetical protein